MLINYFVGIIVVVFVVLMEMGQIQAYPGASCRTNTDCNYSSGEICITNTNYDEGSISGVCRAPAQYEQKSVGLSKSAGQSCSSNSECSSNLCKKASSYDYRGRCSY